MLGIINIPINQYLFFFGVRMSTAPNVALAYAMAPVFVLMIAVLFYNEKASYLKSTGIIIACLGAILILFERGFDFFCRYKA